MSPAAVIQNVLMEKKKKIYLFDGVKQKGSTQILERSLELRY
jgi:hypothetical protein